MIDPGGKLDARDLGAYTKHLLEYSDQEYLYPD